MPWAIRSNDELLRPFFSGALDRAPVGFVISTIGEDDSQYVRANAAYTRLVGRSWSEIRDANMVAAGAAIPSPQRSRRLWLLDRRGAYENELAEIGHASGLKKLCALSAQRVIFEGRAYDFEYLIELSPDKLPADAQGLLASPHNTLSPIPAERPFASQACYTDNISRALATMRDDLARQLVIDMLSAVSRGLFCLGQTMPTHHPLARLAQRYARDALGRELDDQAYPLAAVAFQDLKRADAEQRLLDLAGDIWALARFQQRDLKAKLLALVTPYTRQPTL